MTLSHPAAVVPLRRLGLPMSAMAIGSMVPDLPLFMGPSQAYGVSHSVVGVLTLDLVATLVLLLAWNALLRDALVDLAPDTVRGRLAPRRRLSLSQWLWVPVAAVLGSLTHVVWDAFTHANRWGVVHVSQLQAAWGPLPGYQWAQFLSGVVGAVVVLVVCFRFVASRPPRGPGQSRVLPAAVLPVVVGAAIACGLLAGLARAADGLHAVAFHSVVQGILALSAGVVVSCLAWLLAARHRSGPAG